MTLNVSSCTLVLHLIVALCLIYNNGADTWKYTVTVAVLLVVAAVIVVLFNLDLSLIIFLMLRLIDDDDCWKYVVLMSSLLLAADYNKVIVIIRSFDDNYFVSDVM